MQIYDLWFCFFSEHWKENLLHPFIATINKKNNISWSTAGFILTFVCFTQFAEGEARNGEKYFYHVCLQTLWPWISQKTITPAGQRLVRGSLNQTQHAWKLLLLMDKICWTLSHLSYKMQFTCVMVGLVHAELSHFGEGKGMMESTEWEARNTQTQGARWKLYQRRESSQTLSNMCFHWWYNKMYCLPPLSSSSKLFFFLSLFFLFFCLLMSSPWIQHDDFFTGSTFDSSAEPHHWGDQTFNLRSQPPLKYSHFLSPLIFPCSLYPLLWLLLFFYCALQLEFLNGPKPHYWEQISDANVA